MSLPVLQVEKIGKLYRIGATKSAPKHWKDSLYSKLLSPLGYLREVTRPPETSEVLWACRDISFQVERGEVIGLIGRNGAGKSTLLKILARTTAPTEGRIVMRGRVGALLEVGTGFNPDLTGRENIYLSGSILGMGRKEIVRKFDEIVEFSEIGTFLDTPVKRYSSGMYVRLAFAVASHLEPEMLILDEVLSVGDLGFQQKCLKRLSKLRASGMTIFLVSHSMTSIQAVCQRALLLHQGHLIADGAAMDVIDQYRDYLQPPASNNANQPGIHRGENVKFISFDIFGEDGLSRREFHFGELTRIRIVLDAPERIEKPTINFGLRRGDGVVICNFNNLYDEFEIDYIAGECVLEGWLPPLRLIPDHYEIHILVWHRGGHWGGGAQDGDLAKALPIAARTFGSLRIRGVGLNAHDGAFQSPARKWRFTRQDTCVEYDKMDDHSIERASAQFLGTG